MHMGFFATTFEHESIVAFGQSILCSQNVMLQHAWTYVHSATMCDDDSGVPTNQQTFVWQLAFLT